MRNLRVVGALQQSALAEELNRAAALVLESMDSASCKLQADLHPWRPHEVREGSNVRHPHKVLLPFHGDKLFQSKKARRRPWRSSRLPDNTLV